MVPGTSAAAGASGSEWGEPDIVVLGEGLEEEAGGGVDESSPSCDSVPRKGTAAWYHYMRHQPIVPGSDVSGELPAMRCVLCGATPAEALNCVNVVTSSHMHAHVDWTCRYVFKEGLHPVAKDMSDLLRGALLHYLRHDEFNEDVRRSAQSSLLTYSALAQEVVKAQQRVLYKSHVV